MFVKNRIVMRKLEPKSKMSELITVWKIVWENKTKCNKSPTLKYLISEIKTTNLKL